MKMNTSNESTALVTTNKTTSSLKTNSTKSTVHKCSANCNCSASQKRPMNAFLIFCKRQRSVVKQKYPHLENRSITKILGEWWAKIDLEQKKKYTELARNYKEAFMKANPHFKWYGQKWYKTDVKLPSNMQQPCSPPYVSSFTPSTTRPTGTTSNNSNVSSFNSLAKGNNGQSTSFSNEKNEKDHIRNSPLSSDHAVKSNGLNSTNQSQSNLAQTSSSLSSDTKKSLSNDEQANKTVSLPSNNLTPKPPKKRYLENGEFKEPALQNTLGQTTSSTFGSQVISKPNSMNPECQNNQTNQINRINQTKQTKQSTQMNSKSVEKQTENHKKPSNNSQNTVHQSKNYAIGGPPVLDIETMNRVIENAFGPSASSYHHDANVVHSSDQNSKKNDSHPFLSQLSIANSTMTTSVSQRSPLANQTKSNDANHHHNKSDKTNDLRCNEKFNEPNEQFDKITLPSHSDALNSDQKMTTTFRKSINEESRSNSPINSSPIDKITNSTNSTSSTSNSDKDKQMAGNIRHHVNSAAHKNRTTPAVPLSSCKEDDDDDDKPLNLSSSTIIKGPTQQVLIDNLIEKFLNNSSAGQGNPMPAEMLQNSQSFTPLNYGQMSKASSSQSRKERSCKGKRYLEMLNENKLTKRSKNALSSSISNGDESSNGAKTSSNCPNNSSSSTQSSSKWVSGGFDLEVHIAALPQLETIGDNHLIDVLDNKAKHATDTSSSSHTNQDQSSNNVLLNNNEHNLTKKDASSPVAGKLTIDFMETNASKNENVNENNRQVDLAEKIVERLNINSQSLNECDKLNTLADIALQQAHRQPSSISPSCT